MQKIVVLAISAMLCMAAGCLMTGCATFADQDQFNRLTQAIELAQEIAEKHNLTTQIELVVDGDPSVGTKHDFYLNTGISAVIRLQGATRPQP